MNKIKNILTKLPTFQFNIRKNTFSKYFESCNLKNYSLNKNSDILKRRLNINLELHKL